MNRTKGVKIFDSMKVDMAETLSARARAFFRPDAKIDLTSGNGTESPLWSKAVRSFATAAVACGLVATVNLAQAPTQAYAAQDKANVATQTEAQQYVSLGSMRFTDLVKIRDSIGLDEATLRDRIMPQFDMAEMSSMTPNEKAQLIGGLYWAAEALEGFDRAMQQSRLAIAQRGEPPRTHAEEVNSWQTFLDDRTTEHKKKEYFYHLGAPKPVAAVDPAALQRTIERLQQVIILQAAAPAEQARSYERERSSQSMGG
ncbi:MULTISPECIES: hypothetical protein [Achromobacter]|uniref:Uncharacterized protein n=1 Tax=Achromobacter xylosoxidans (strain A8) TaxID=762376 RepID=E3HY84_ACHXA|nr:hypothetical protein [Achromobacter xylosoxidans]ADP20038.1 hypothetical protein AXYL_06755 [Achromobacter xylosoxidans A8]